MILSEHKQQTLDRMVRDLQQVEHVAAVVLGGSHCTGMAHAHSDLDIGIYYHSQQPFDIGQIAAVARAHSTGGDPTVTDFYQWGAWVNGGAWIVTESGEVDLLYRNIDQVRDTIGKSKQGVWEQDFQQQPPFGFSSVIYLAETHDCIPLYDPHQVIEELKREVAVYPPNLQRAIVQQALWSAEFTRWQAGKFARQEDLYNTAGCVTRALKNLIDALFALNGWYPIGDKHAIRRIQEAPVCPDRLEEQIADIVCLERHTLTARTEQLGSLFAQVRAAAGSLYTPYFEL
ncbi:MAG: nucleotidyltransferase domain-containing protein [Bacteroidia bacterium]|nr:nucleotidyltransferase domain-containing protein [Bacteroidia bacterium]